MSTSPEKQSKMDPFSRPDGGQGKKGMPEQSTSKSGAFQRVTSSFRDRVTADKSGAYPAEAGRYHLYVSLACPWAHRTLIMRKLKGLERAIDVTVVHYMLDGDGWRFASKDEDPQCDLDPLHKDFKLLRDVYRLSQADYSGRVTVPVLFDKTKQKIVNNESSEIIRMLNSEFNALCATKEQRALDFYPDGHGSAQADSELIARIDAINDKVYHNVNNGVYKCGFAGSQEAYEEAYDALFAMLDELESTLAKQRYLADARRITEADVRLITTLLRFDAVYVVHFKCNKRRLCDYPNLWAYAREMFALPAVKETTNFGHIKKHYFMSHLRINPTQLVAKGFDVDWDEPHHRDKLAAL